MFCSPRHLPLFLFPVLLWSCTIARAPKDESPPYLTLLTSTGSNSSAASSEPAMNVRTLVQSGTTFDLGSSDAPLTLLLFTNHACPYCRKFQEEIVSRLKTDFINTKKLRLRTAILPIQKYPMSRQETAALFCSQEQGKGEVMHAALFALVERTPESLLTTAKALQMKEPDFSACLTSPQAAAWTQAQANLASVLRVTLVPTLFLDDEKRVGLPRYADLRGWVENVLSSR